MNGTTADLYRSSGQDRHGDPVDMTFLGTITNVLVGSISSSRVNDREDSADGNGQIGFLKKGKLTDGSPAPKVGFGDRIVVQGQKFDVQCDPNWDTVHSMTGTTFPRYWVDVRYRR